MQSARPADAKDGDVTISTDDLLPMLVYCTICSSKASACAAHGPPARADPLLPQVKPIRWHADLLYMRDFQPEDRAAVNSSQLNFFFSTLQAVIEHVDTGRAAENAPRPASVSDPPRSAVAAPLSRRRSSALISTR
jgi:hypothetical protein